MCVFFFWFSILSDKKQSPIRNYTKAWGSTNEQKFRVIVSVFQSQITFVGSTKTDHLLWGKKTLVGSIKKDKYLEQCNDERNYNIITKKIITSLHRNFYLIHNVIEVIIYI